MFVLKELEKSVKLLSQVANDLESIDNITELDAYEVKAQKVVFNLQMQANQVAGELVPLIKNKRTNLQYSHANDVLAKIRATQNKVQETIKKVEDGGDSNRQRKSNSGNSKPKSTKKAK